jgi:hypothetical protein
MSSAGVRTMLGAALALTAPAASGAVENAVLATLSPGEVAIALLDGARDSEGWRLGAVRSRYATAFRSGAVDFDGTEDTFAFDCAGRAYAYARRTRTLAGVVVEDRDIPRSRWTKIPVDAKASIPAQAFERFCALKDVPAR